MELTTVPRTLSSLNFAYWTMCHFSPHVIPKWRFLFPKRGLVCTLMSWGKKYFGVDAQKYMMRFWQLYYTHRYGNTSWTRTTWGHTIHRNTKRNWCVDMTFMGTIDTVRSYVFYWLSSSDLIHITDIFTTVSVSPVTGIHKSFPMSTFCISDDVITVSGMHLSE